MENQPVFKPAQPLNKERAAAFQGGVLQLFSIHSEKVPAA